MLFYSIYGREEEKKEGEGEGEEDDEYYDNDPEEK
jgi:hypothetical protein